MRLEKIHLKDLPVAKRDKSGAQKLEVTQLIQGHERSTSGAAVLSSILKAIHSLNDRHAKSSILQSLSTVRSTESDDEHNRGAYLVRKGAHSPSHPNPRGQESIPKLSKPQEFLKRTCQSKVHSDQKQSREEDGLDTSKCRRTIFFH